jgi:hypothetical protein
MKRASFTLLAFVVVASTFGEEPAPTTALQVQAARPPQRVHGSDGCEHIEYNLVITNVGLNTRGRFLKETASAGFRTI